MKAWEYISSGSDMTDSIFKPSRFFNFGIVLLLLMISSCRQSENHSAKALVEAYFDAAFTKDYELLDELLHDDFIFIGPKLSDTLDKKALIKSWQSTHQRNDTLLMRNAKIYDVSMQEGLSVDSSLVLHYYDARFHNSDLNLWVEFPVHVKFSLFKEKIYKAQIIMNQSDIQSQLGYTITPPKKK